MSNQMLRRPGNGGLLAFNVSLPVLTQSLFLLRVTVLECLGQLQDVVLPFSAVQVLSLW
jgi:hypothetical protein